MDNDVASNGGGERGNDERKEGPLASTSQIDSDVPLLPPPSLDPSSSAIPLKNHDPSLVVSVSEPVSVTSQIAQLFATVAQHKSEHDAHLARLSSENEAQASTVARLSSEDVSLKSEVALLKRTNEEQHRSNGEITRESVPGGFWVWESRREEGKEGKGRWLWSLEKYKVLPPPIVASGPPLLSLPAELLTIILKLLKRKERLVLCRVSYRLLELASEEIYTSPLRMYANEAHSFVESRVFHPAPKSERITLVLLPEELRFCGSLFFASEFEDLVDLASSLSSRPSPLLIETLAVEVPHADSFVLWVDLLRFVDPVTFQVWLGKDVDIQVPPTVRFVAGNFVDPFISDWSRLQSFMALGPGSVLLVEGTERTSVFEACLRRCSPDLPRVKVDFWTRTLTDVESSKVAKETNLSTFIDTLVGFGRDFDLVSIRFSVTKATSKKGETKESQQQQSKSV